MAKARQADRGRARRRQERRLRRHGLHDGICRRASSQHDEVVEDKGVALLIDPKAVLFLLGTEMDFKIDKLSAQFVFNNPNQTSACGCGESVQLDAAADRRRRGALSVVLRSFPRKRESAKFVSLPGPRVRGDESTSLRAACADAVTCAGERRSIPIALTPNAPTEGTRTIASGLPDLNVDKRKVVLRVTSRAATR